LLVKYIILKKVHSITLMILFASQKPVKYFDDDVS